MNNYQNNTVMELENLQDMIVSICTQLNRPIRKKQLIKMVTDLFETGTPKSVEYAVIRLVEQNRLIKKKYIITVPEHAQLWNGKITATDEGIIKYLLLLKDEIKFDAFFNVYADEHITPHIFFKYINMVCPVLIAGDMSFAYMEQMEKVFDSGLNNSFYAEMNDRPADGWLTNFFSNLDCKIIIQNMDKDKNHAFFKLVLIPSRNKNFNQARKAFKEFEANIPSYFNKDIKVHVKKSIITL